MKRTSILILIVCIAFGLAGCDAVQKKFTRKKKVVKKPKIYQVKRYEKKPTPELYNKHYVYWETWSGELIELLGKNHKKDVRCIEEMVGQLKDMQNILVPEKGAQLQKHIDAAQEVKTIIDRGDMSFAVQGSVRSTLEREDRAIKRDFITSKVKNDLKTTFEEDVTDDEGAPLAESRELPPAPSMAATQEQEPDGSQTR